MVIVLKSELNPVWTTFTKNVNGVTSNKYCTFPYAGQLFFFSTLCYQCIYEHFLQLAQITIFYCRINLSVCKHFNGLWIAHNYWCLMSAIHCPFLWVLFSHIVVWHSMTPAIQTHWFCMSVYICSFSVLCFLDPCCNKFKNS